MPAVCLTRKAPVSSSCGELRMPCQTAWLAAASYSKLRDCLELANYPPVRAGGHQYDIVHDRMFIVDGLAAIMDFKVVLGRVVQFDHVSYWRIKNGIEFMVLVQVVRGDPAALLVAYCLP